jgi:hypothetical protein
MHKNTSVEGSSAEIVARIGNCQITPLKIQESFYECLYNTTSCLIDALELKCYNSWAHSLRRPFSLAISFNLHKNLHP